MSRLPRIAVAVCALAAASCLGLAAPAAASSAGGRLATSPASSSASPVSVAITSISPQVATGKGKVTVRGQLRNSSPAALAGVSVQLRWSSQPLQGRGELQMYADGQISDAAVSGAVSQARGSLAAGAARNWSITVTVKKLQLAQFGVYPLAAQAVSADGTPLATSRTFLPYWPGRPGDPRPDRVNISWILPLIDKPHQTACPGLLDNSLAASVGPGGRLSGLLAAGTAHPGAAVTWAIDPALLSGVQTMTRPGGYHVGASSQCQGGHHVPASKAAAAWVATVRTAVRSQPVLLTPYADVDIAGLVRQSMGGDLSRAFRLGRSTGARILDRPFPAPVAGAQGAAQDLAAFAWPAGGIANYAVLQTLAVDGIRTVILNSSTMPPLSVPPPAFTPSAVTRTPNGETGDTDVLLTDSGLTELLQSASSPRESPGAAFTIRQRFLAETAMIAAEAPHLQRAVVVAPPRQWSPPAGLASGLLAETASAPWLKPVPLSRLAAATSRAGQVARARPHGSNRAALSKGLLRNVRALDRRVQLLAGIRAPDAALYEAVASIESSAWRGKKSDTRAYALLDQVSDYVTSQLGGLSIIQSQPITLGGLRGSVPVSIRSRLDYPVQVRLTFQARGRLTLSSPGVITVPAGSGHGQIKTIKLKVHAAAIGTTGVELGLTTLNGKPLPGTTARMTIQATQFGTLALVIVAAALGVFMISSAARAIRRGRGVPADPGAGTAAQVSPGSAQATEADSVVSGAGGQREPDGEPSGGPRAGPAGAAGAGGGAMAESAAVHDPTKETDDYARAPGSSDRS